MSVCPQSVRQPTRGMAQAIEWTAREMNHTTERVVDILQRSGPGALSAWRLQDELKRCRPRILVGIPELRVLAEESEGRLTVIEISADDTAKTLLDAWVLLTHSQDAPPRSWVATKLWESLSATAAELDHASRTEVARWILQAESASRTCSAVARYGLWTPRP